MTTASATGIGHIDLNIYKISVRQHKNEEEQESKKASPLVHGKHIPRNTLQHMSGGNAALGPRVFVNKETNVFNTIIRLFVLNDVINKTIC